MTPRLQHQFSRFGTDLHAAFREREPTLPAIDATALFEKFVAADPTRGNIAVQWLIRTYLARGFLCEDLGKARETLELFQAHKHRLPVAQRSLTAYSTLGALWSAVAPFTAPDRPLEGKEARRAAREAARRESRILLERDDGTTVVVPLTEKAARWWGRGTRWCTSADHENVFDRYNKLGPLVVLVTADGTKIQMHIGAGPGAQYQLSGADDAPLDWADVLRHWNDLAPLLKWAVKRAGRAIDLVPTSRLDEATCIDAVSSNAIALRNIPAPMRTPAVIEAAVRKNGIALTLIEPGQQTYDLCLAAVSNFSGALAFVDFAFLDARMYNAAISALVPGPTSDSYYGSGILNRIPRVMRTRQIYEEVVSRSGRDLSNVPDPLRDRGLCITALRQDGLAIRSVPLHLLDREICLIASATNGCAIKHMPAKLIEKDICLAAVRNSGLALEWVPAGLRDTDVCIAAVLSDEAALLHVPPSIAALGEFRQQIREHGWLVPEGHMEIGDQDTLCAALRQWPHALRFLEDVELTDQAYMAALRQDARVVAYIPPDRRKPLSLACMMSEPGERFLGGPPSPWTMRDLDELEAMIVAHADNTVAAAPCTRLAA